MSTELLIALVPLPPLLAFFAIVLGAYRSNRLSHTLAVGAMGASWAAAMVVVARALAREDLAGEPFAASLNWLPTGSGWLRMGVLIDPLSALTLFFVAWTCLAIFVYSIGYHNFGKPRDSHDQAGLPPHAGGVEPMYGRFFAFISLFAFAMLALVVSDNLLLLFIGWEIMGLCSYLLIGFWYGKPSAREAMVKAFLTTRVGDVFMLLGLVALYSATGTLHYRAILADEGVLSQLATTPSGVLGLPLAGLIGLLLFLGTVGKSAQWPLHVWLPDAMEGPTPVSAMIHAATMVSAGVYLVLRFFPLITAGWHEGQPLTTTMTVVAAVGAFTALFAATIAVAQNDIKRVLAYSTISQLGYMIAAAGIGSFVAAGFHLFTHAFFKALLFLGSGSVIHGMEHGLHAGGSHDDVDPQNLFAMGGLRRRMPLTFWTFLIGGFALSGFPVLTAGFWSKDEILADAYGRGHLVVFAVLAAAALLTAFYTMRQIGLAFLGAPRSHAAEHAHEPAWTMRLPLVGLAFFAVAAGWIGIPEHFPGLGGLVPNWLHEFLGSSLAEHPAEAAFSPIPLLVSIGVALGGLLLGWAVYRNLPAGAPDPLARALGPFHRLLQRKYYFDEIYDSVFVRPAYWVAETMVSTWIDGDVIDGALHAIGRFSLRLGSWLRNRIDLPVVNGSGDLVGESVKRSGGGLRLVQTGRVQQYLVIALVFVGILFTGVVLFRP